jgi:diguanylate cyclase (GGDEF)-like protein
MSENTTAAVDRVPQTESVALHQVKKHANPQEQKKQIVNEMLTALPSELRFPDEDRIQQDCSILVEAFYMSLMQDNSIHFQTALMESIHKLELADVNIDYWQEMISILRREMTQLSLLSSQDSTANTLAEEILHQARIVIAESVQQQDHRHQYRQSMETLALHTLTAHLSATLSEVQVLEILNTDLQKVGIRHTRVMFFEAEQDDPVAWSIALNMDIDRAPHRFLSRQFPPAELYASDEVLNLILLPLTFQSEVLGYATFDADDLGACAVVARQLAATIKVSRLHAQVVELSLTDPLTNLHNRRYLDLFLTNEIARGHRFSHALSIIMVDIDHFKSYNDQFGHPEGDQALRQVANCLTDGRRTVDVVARIGGEEFAIILPETDINGAMNCAEKLRASVAAISNLQRPLTISLGIAVLNKNIYKPEALLEQADQALYEAKKTGRNRISIYEEKNSE